MFTMKFYIILIFFISRTNQSNTTRKDVPNIANEDKFLNSSQLLRKYGYPVEDHTVTTEDGYVLSLVRIPKPGRPVVFLMHGFICSSDDFITSGVNEALAYALSNASYDVWLGNARGNKYSRKNINISPKERKFWDFSWNEIGIYDLPAMIDYTLMVTNQTQLSYIGHSQGNTVMFVLCSERPEYNKKIKIFVSLATIAYTAHTIQPFLRAIAPYAVIVSRFLFDSGFYELLPSDENIKFLTSILCDLSEEIQMLCVGVIFSVSGDDYTEVDDNNLPVKLSHFPSGSSIKQLIHYLQNTESKRFAKYDYGANNAKIYGQDMPPSYKLDKVTVPIAMFQGEHDYLSSLKDVDLLLPQVPNVVEVFKVPLPQFGHFDFIWAKNAKELVYDRVLELLDKYS